MSYKASYVSGDNKAICDRCGRLYKMSTLRKEWNGLYTCSSCWEPRQTQDFVRGVKDNMAVAVSRPEQGDSFTEVCFTKTSIPVWARAGCAIAGNSSTVEPTPVGTFDLVCTSNTSFPQLAVAGCAVTNSTAFKQ